MTSECEMTTTNYMRMLVLLPALLLMNVALAAPTAPVAEICSACHGEDGAGLSEAAVPIIAGIPATHLEEAIYSYQDGARQCVAQPPMCVVIAELSEAEVIDAADYYAALERVWAREPRDPALAEEGARIHAELCAKCHLRPDDPDVENALGIPLHGQRAGYLRLAFNAYLSGDRETLVPVMAQQIGKLDAADIEALVNYYASFEP